MKGKIFLSLVIIFSLLSVRAGAQRTSVGTPFVGLSAVSTFTGSGVRAECGVYTIRGYWKVTANAAGRGLALHRAGGEYISDISCMQYDAAFDWMWRIYARRDHVWNLYGGAGALLGLEAIDPHGDAPKSVILPYQKKNTFLYGLEGALDGEWFFLSRTVPDLALTAGLRVPVKITSQAYKFCYEVNVGLRYDF